MARYRIRKAGYFMGKYYPADTLLSLDPRQAKYALLSGQLEAADEEHAMALKARAAAASARKKGAPQAQSKSPFRSRRIGATVAMER